MAERLEPGSVLRPVIGLGDDGGRVALGGAGSGDRLGEGQAPRVDRGDRTSGSDGNGILVG
jgi:hypothetical protein